MILLELYSNSNMSISNITDKYNYISDSGNFIFNIYFIELGLIYMLANDNIFVNISIFSLNSAFCNKTLKKSELLNFFRLAICSSFQYSEIP